MRTIILWLAVFAFVGWDMTNNHGESTKLVASAGEAAWSTAAPAILHHLAGLFR